MVISGLDMGRRCNLEAGGFGSRVGRSASVSESMGQVDPSPGTSLACSIQIEGERDRVSVSARAENLSKRFWTDGCWNWARVPMENLAFRPESAESAQKQPMCGIMR